MTGKTRLRSVLIFATAMVLALGSCIKTEDYSEIEQTNIENYIAANPDIPFTKMPSGLYFYEVTPGSGAVAKAHDTAYVRYTGKFLNGSVFDPGSDTLIFAVGEDGIIKGFDEAVSYMRLGGKSKVIIPSDLAYGPTGWYIIPGYTPLLFDIALVKLAPGPGAK